jgi:membrane protein involved in colicin uptake
MSKQTLDRKQTFAQIYGDNAGRHYEQDGKFFNSDGKLWRDPSAKETAAEKKEREEAEAAEAARLAAEAEAAKKAEGGGDQLGQQLGA